MPELPSEAQLEAVEEAIIESAVSSSGQALTRAQIEDLVRPRFAAMRTTLSFRHLIRPRPAVLNLVAPDVRADHPGSP